MHFNQIETQINNIDAQKKNHAVIKPLHQNLSSASPAQSRNPLYILK